jgi:hypothetical protein
LLAPDANIPDILSGFWKDSMERGLNLQEKTVPGNSQPALPKLALVRGGSEPKTMPANSLTLRKGGR